MFKELKYNLEMVFRSTTFRLSTILLVGIVTFTLFSIFKNKEFLQMPYADISISRIFLMTVFGLILFCILFVLQDSILFEKTSGRVERLLSNGFKPQLYWWGSTIATSIATELLIILIFLDFYIFRLFLFPKMPMIGIVNTLIPLSFFNIGASSLSCVLILKIRRVEIIRSLLFFIPYLIFFGGNKLIMQIQPKYQSILLILVFAAGVLIFVLSILIANKLNSESIVLTIP